MKKIYLILFILSATQLHAQNLTYTDILQIKNINNLQDKTDYLKVKWYKPCQETHMELGGKLYDFCPWNQSPRPLEVKEENCSFVFREETKFTPIVIYSTKSVESYSALKDSVKSKGFKLVANLKTDCSKDYQCEYYDNPTSKLEFEFDTSNSGKDYVIYYRSL